MVVSCEQGNESSGQQLSASHERLRYMELNIEYAGPNNTQEHRYLSTYFCITLK